MRYYIETVIMFSLIAIPVLVFVGFVITSAIVVLGFGGP